MSLLLAGLLAGDGRAADPPPSVSVTTLPGAASCFAGTAGTDQTIFLRGKSSQTDCDTVGGGSPCLARREFAGDGANGRPISLLSAIVLRPSVSGDGTLVNFVEPGFNVCQMLTNSEDSEVCYGEAQIPTVYPHTLSVSPDGTLFGFTQRDAFNGFVPSNRVDVINASFIPQELQKIVAVAGPGGGALQVDNVELRHDGAYLIVDALNPVTGLWGIYAVDRATGVTTALVAPASGLQIRNPALAQTSDDYIVFDALDPISFANTVLAANTRTGVLSVVTTTVGLAYPSYTGDDSAVVVSDFDAAQPSLANMDIQPLSADRLTPVGTRTRWLTDGGAGVIYRRGTFDGTALASSICAAVCGDVDESQALDVGDRTTLRSFMADPTGSPLSPGAVDLCDVIGAPGDCNAVDLVVITRALANLMPGIANVCSAAS